MVDLYTAILNGSDLAVFNRNVNANNLLGDDDYYAYFGGLGAAISKITGKSPTMIINNLGNPNNPKTETLAESIARDLRTTYFNPLWIKEMMRMGPGAASHFHDVTHLLPWDLLNPGTATSNQFQQIYDNYVKDSLNIGLNDYFQRYNPYTQQAIMYNLLQSIHSNRWNADDATKRELANQFANSVIKNGWSGDPLDMDIVNEWLNSMDAKLVEGVKSKLYASTMNSAFAPSNPQNPNPQEPNPQDGGSSSDGGSSAPGQTSSGVSYAAATSSSSGQSSAGSSGQKAYEVSKTSQGSSKDNENYVYAIVGLIALMGLIGFGYFKGVGRN
jgi:cobaltochelatase CobN